MMKQTVIALLFLGPLSVAAFSSLHTQSTQTLLPTSQSISSSVLLVSKKLDLEEDASSDLPSKDQVSKTENNQRFGPRKLVGRIGRGIWSVPRKLISRISDRRAIDKFHAETAKIEKQSRNWILRTVVKLNLCPFAYPVLKNHQVKLIVVRGTDDNEIAQAVVQELLTHRESPSGENSIVVAPDYHPDDFYGYMRMVRFLEEGVMEELGLFDYVQIAPFHPNFVFDFKELEEKNKSPIIDNYVNRSPYPMFHVLKSNDVDHAVETSCGGDPGKVWRRNARLLRKFETVMGKQEAVDFLLSFSTQESEIPEEYPQEIVNQVMKEIQQDDDDGPVEGMVRGVWEI